MRSRPAAFVKFFSEEAHADQFLRGSLFMRKLRYFQRLEALEMDDGRPDAHEGLASWHQPDRTELTINFEGFDPIKITGADLAAPVAITRNIYSDLYVFCMSTVRMLDPAELSGDHEEIEAQMQANAPEWVRRAHQQGMEDRLVAAAQAAKAAKPAAPAPKPEAAFDAARRAGAMASVASANAASATVASRVSNDNRNTDNRRYDETHLHNVSVYPATGTQSSIMAELKQAARGGKAFAAEADYGKA